jgi:hypothetical protein
MDDLPADIIALINSHIHGLYDLKDWAGTVMPGNSVVIFRLPQYLLNDDYSPTGTPITDVGPRTSRMVNIRNICKKHLASGVLPIVRFYDVAGNITADIPPLDRRYF